MNTMLFGNGTGNSGKDMLGLAACIGLGNDAGGSSFAGIDATDSDNSWWRSSVKNQAGAIDVASMATMYNNVSVGNDQPTSISSW